MPVKNREIPLLRQGAGGKPSVFGRKERLGFMSRREAHPLSQREREGRVAHEHFSARFTHRKQRGTGKEEGGSRLPPSLECRWVLNVVRRASYFSLARVSLIAAKFGRSFGVAVCSAYCTTPALSTTNAARALVEPKPSRSGSSTP